jgi:hypothetical protein
MLELAAESLPILLSGSEGTTDPAEAQSAQARIGQAFEQLDAAFAEARRERVGLFVAEPDPEPLLRALMRLRHDLVMIGRAGAEPLPDELKPRLGPPLRQVALGAADHLRLSAQSLAHGRDPPSDDGIDSALDDCARALVQARGDDLMRKLSIGVTERIYTLGFALEQMRRNLADLDRCVREAARER